MCVISFALLNYLILNLFKMKISYDHVCNQVIALLNYLILILFKMHLIIVLDGNVKRKMVRKVMGLETQALKIKNTNFLF